MRELTKTMKKYDIRLEDCSEFGNFVIPLINLIKINRKSENVASEVFSVFLHEHGLSCYNRPVAPLGHSILIPSQPVIAHSHYCCMLNGEATYAYFIVFGFTRSRLEPTIYSTSGEHAKHYTIDAVYPIMIIYSILNMGNTKGATSGAGITHSFQAYSVVLL